MPDPFVLEGKVALVTGAAMGIGRATSLQLARAGARKRIGRALLALPCKSAAVWLPVEKIAIYLSQISE